MNNRERIERLEVSVQDLYRIVTKPDAEKLLASLGQPAPVRFQAAKTVDLRRDGEINLLKLKVSEQLATIEELRREIHRLSEPPVEPDFWECD